MQHTTFFSRIGKAVFEQETKRFPGEECETKGVTTHPELLRDSGAAAVFVRRHTEH